MDTTDTSITTVRDIIDQVQEIQNVADRYAKQPGDGTKEREAFGEAMYETACTLSQTLRFLEDTANRFPAT